MDDRSHSLSRNELLFLRWLLGCALGLLSAATVLFLDVEALGLLLLVMGVAVLAILFPRLPALVPARAERVAVPVLVLIAAWDLWKGEGLLSALTRLALLLLAYRIGTYRQRRDDLQLILLGLFLIVVAGVMTVSLAFAALLVLFTLCSLLLLLVITVSEANAPADAAPEPKGPPAWALEAGHLRLLRRLVQVFNWRLGMAVGLLFLLMVGGSAALFVVIPRYQIETSLFFERFFPRKAKSGFSELVRFGEVNEISQDQGLALSIDIPAESPLGSSPYLRMLVLDDYSSSGGFRMSPRFMRESFGPEGSSAVVRGFGVPATQATGTWIFYLEPGVSRHLPLPGRFQIMQFRDPQSFRQSPRLNLVSLRAEPLSMTAYRVVNPVLSEQLPDAEFALRLANAPKAEDGLPRDPARFLLSLPAAKGDLESLQGIVRDLGGRADSATFVAAASRYLSSRHDYSLSSSLPAGSGDPLLRWMQGGSPGHCELFAGSLVLLARAAGIPARLVVGFRGGTWNGYSNNLVVRNSDAHAWCEVWDGKSAWLRADPTPGASLTRETVVERDLRSSRLDTSWSARFDSYRIFWYRRIVNFDQQTQISAVVSMYQSFDRLRRNLRDSADGLLHWLHRQGGRLAEGFVVPWVLLGGTAVLALLLPWLALRAWRRWGWRLVIGERHSGDRLRREAGRLLVALGAAGLEERPVLRAELLRLRYGPGEATKAAGPVFLEASRHLRARRLAAVTGWLRPRRT
jgi:hypothetical protein